MVVSRHRRQILLFLAAILIPAAVLVGLSIRTMAQDRELAAKRASDRSMAAAAQVRRELSARLDAIKSQEINRAMRVGGANEPESSAVVFVAVVTGDRALPPWEMGVAPDSPKFARNREDGERIEFGRNDYAGAADCYRRAGQSAATSSESAHAKLLEARALLKASQKDSAAKLYERLLAAPPDARDDQGVGYRFYAAERMIATGQESAAGNFLINSLSSGEQLTLPELYLLRQLVGTTETSQRIAQMEQAAELARDYGKLRGQLELAAAVPYGAEPWLVTAVSPEPSRPGLLLALSSGRLAPPGVQLTRRTEGAVALGEPFPGVYARWADGRLAESARGSVPLSIQLAGLGLVVGIALFGGYLLLRDVNREVRIAEVRSHFVAGVSHELKTPLTAIRMFAETLALNRMRDERMRSEYLETIVNESERLARLVDNVLDFSKLEQGKKIYRFQSTRLDEVAGAAVRAMRFPLAQQGFDLRLSVAEDIPELWADADALQQAILNLLTNAVKYSGDSREIEMRVATRDGDAVIEVEDRGLGLEPQERMRVFEKFYRAPSHERRMIAGTGLGLTLVSHIAEAHGGRVEVESTAGVGSTFRILIPIEKAA
jgi:signal transduction histidine kinase